MPWSRLFQPGPGTETLTNKSSSLPENKATLLWTAFGVVVGGARQLPRQAEQVNNIQIADEMAYALPIAATKSTDIERSRNTPISAEEPPEANICLLCARTWFLSCLVPIVIVFFFQWAPGAVLFCPPLCSAVLCCAQLSASPSSANQGSTPVSAADITRQGTKKRSYVQGTTSSSYFSCSQHVRVSHYSCAIKCGPVRGALFSSGFLVLPRPGYIYIKRCSSPVGARQGAIHAAFRHPHSTSCPFSLCHALSYMAQRRQACACNLRG